MKEIRDNARQLMKGYCRVCPRCDGKACAGEVPGMGGIGTAASFKANISALDSLKFNMRLIHDVTEPDTTTSLLGIDLALPVLAAPIGGVVFNMGGKVTEEEYIEGIIHGCRSKGILGCTGDGVPPFIHESGFEAIRRADGHGIPFIKPWEDQELNDKFKKAEQTGAKIVGMDIDAAGLITLRKMGRPVGPKTLDALKKIIAATPMRFILKGVMTPDEALLAVEAGADAIVVSNHGGRVLDHTPGAARVLAEIAERVKGKITILADGGVRTGGDVLKLMALGADAVMIGRPFSIACVGGLQQGVETFIDTIHQELKQTMVLTGTADLTRVTPAILAGQGVPC
ncbi:MAG: alpha-hydroxy-acid oxidizing protein [Desulfobacterium sp.]|jgi:isopentenyl diphosphate isomerase/L-lactate dehydrogenase-like FMN-dependent dehydrogenase|nr:alpha-hydroxy-acid oxidizing protein [Desulfobacterium sp.]